MMLGILFSSDRAVTYVVCGHTSVAWQPTPWLAEFPVRGILWIMDPFTNRREYCPDSVLLHLTASSA